MKQLLSTSTQTKTSTRSSSSSTIPFFRLSKSLTFPPLYLFLLLYFPVSPLYAQVDLQTPLNQQGDTVVGVTFSISQIEPLILGLASWLLIISGMVMFLCTIITGIVWITSQGNSAQIEAAQSRLTNCLLGLSVSTLALAIFYLIQYFFGLDVIPTP